MSKFMVVGAIYDGSSGVLDSFMVHVDGKPFVTDEIDVAVEMAVSCLYSDLCEYDQVDYSCVGNIIVGFTSDVEVQYKIVSLDGTVVSCDSLLKEQIQQLI